MILQFDNHKNNSYEVITFPWSCTDKFGDEGVVIKTSRNYIDDVYLYFSVKGKDDISLFMYDSLDTIKNIITLDKDNRSTNKTKKYILDLFDSYNRTFELGRHNNKPYGKMTIIYE